MRDFASYMKEGAFSDQVIQMSLREIDAEPLARALVDQDEGIRELIFRNMSARAVAFIKDDLRDLEDAPIETIRAGQELFSRLLEKNASRQTGQGKTQEADKTAPPTIDLSSRNAIIASFCALAEFSKGRGLLPLQGLEAGAGNLIFRKGLLMLIEGWDPLLIRSILEKYKTSLLRARELEYDLLIEGLDSLASRDNSLVTEQRLRALVAGL